MTEKTYTMERIEDCFYSVPASEPRLTLDQLKEKLQRPEWEPAVGEVYWSANGIDNGFVEYNGCGVRANDRPQTLTNHGPAVRALRDGYDNLKEAVELFRCGDLTKAEFLQHVDDNRYLSAVKAFNEVVKDD